MQKQPLLGTRQHPYCCQQPQQIVGSWEQSRSDRKLAFQTRLFIQQSSKLCHTRNFWSWNWTNKHLRLSRASRPYDHWYPRGILDKLLTSSVSGEVDQIRGPVLQYSPQPPEAFVPPVRQHKTSFSQLLFRSEFNLVAISTYLFTPKGCNYLTMIKRQYGWYGRWER